MGSLRNADRSSTTPSYDPAPGVPVPVDIEDLTDRLTRLASTGQAKKNTKHVHTLRGVRGVSDGEVARLLASAWPENRPIFPDDIPDVRQLFFGAHEDGIIAIGLLAAGMTDDPEEVLELGLDLLESVDDVQTADALGWLVLGPAVLAAGRSPTLLIKLAKTLTRDSQRRCIAMAALAWLPEPLEGAAAAALRKRMGEKRIAFVEEPVTEAVHAMMTGLLRDESPAVRKALRRILRAWTQADPDAVVAWGVQAAGGLPKLLRAEVKRAQRRQQAPT